MKQRHRALVAPVCLLLAHCGGDTDSGASAAKIETRLAATGVFGPASGQKFKGGAAVSGGLESLKYHINSIAICESLVASGSGFDNPTGCLELYRGDESGFPYQLGQDYTPLADAARQSDTGFVDLLSDSSRRTLAGSTVLNESHVRSYHYGYITWALPIKFKGTVTLKDGSSLYSHDGRTTFETVGADSYRHYFTTPSTSLRSGPAEEAVVLLPNGGNWFKFQAPFTITQDDIASRRAFVLDLVFNAEGIVKGYADSYAAGNLSERADAGVGGPHVADMTVPMLDLAPVPHRATERVLRESYQGRVQLPDNSFDLRVELYYVEGDPTNTVFGVDVKSLVNGETMSVPPEVAKIAYLERASDGSLNLSSFANLPVIKRLVRVAGDRGTTQVGLVCATHSDRAGAEGGAAIVLDRCPSAELAVTLTLTSRIAVEGGVETAVGGGVDAGAPMPLGVGGIDAGL